MRLDGRMPDLFMVSSMKIHAAATEALLRDACRIDAADRPLIIAGGPKAMYEPWDLFGTDRHDLWGADVVVTGEEYVLLSLLEALLLLRTKHESLRKAFDRARSSGMLDGIPGLVYPQLDEAGVPVALVDTGVQRLLGDLDELPHPTLGFALLERPSRKPTLASRALPANRVRRYSPIGSLVLTLGCKFSCPYCPIPAYNQHEYRAKSGARIADEFVALYEKYGLCSYFGADDNFFNDTGRTMDIVETLARVKIGGLPIRKRLRWGTEVTVHDTLKLKDHLPTMRNAGIRTLWLGVEDMTGTLVKKGQSVNKTTEAFHALQRHGICPMPMMMHHDGQPLISRGPKPYGLLNQVRILRQAGAISMQVLSLVPSPGSKLYGETYASRMVFARADGRAVEERMFGGTYVIASRDTKAWQKQLNLLIAYAYFYNPLRFLLALVRPKSRLYAADAIWQAIGMWGLLATTRRTFGWAVRLWRGPIRWHTAPPRSHIPMIGPGGMPADHALPGTPMAIQPANPYPTGLIREDVQPTPQPDATSCARSCAHDERHAYDVPSRRIADVGAAPRNPTSDDRAR